MATNFGYVERTADSFVNWAEVSKTMTDTLYEVERRREEKKAALDKATQDTLSFLKENPIGENQDANTASIDLADNVSKIMLDASRRLKSGMMTPAEFMRLRESLHVNTKDAYTALSEYQKFFADRMSRASANISSAEEQKNLAEVEGFGDFSKSGFFVNPLTGAIMAAKKTLKNIDGKDVYVMGDNPEDVQSVKGVLNMIRTKIDKFDYRGVAQKYAEGLGQDVRTRKIAGFLKTVSDITGKEIRDVDENAVNDYKKKIAAAEQEVKSAKTSTEKKAKEKALKELKANLAKIESEGSVAFSYMKEEKKLVDALISNPYQKLSLLVDAVPYAPNGKPYETTTKDFDASDPENAHLIKKRTLSNGTQEYDFSEEQEAVASKFMLDNVRSMYDYSEAATQLQSNYRPTSDAETRQRNRESSLATNFARALMSPDDKIKENSLRSIGNALIESGRAIAEISWDPATNQIKWREQGDTGISGSINVASSGGGLGALKDIIGQGGIFGFASEPSAALKQAGEFSRRGGETIVAPKSAINVQYTITSPATATGAASRIAGY